MYKPIRMKPPNPPQTGASKLKNTLTRRRLCYDEHLEKEKLRAELMSKLSECQSLNKMLTEQINSSTRPKRMPKNTLKSKSTTRKPTTIAKPPPPPPQTAKERQLYADVIEDEFKKQLPRTRSGRAVPPRPRIQGLPIHQVIKEKIINDIEKYQEPFKLKKDIINAIKNLDSDADIKGRKDIVAERLKNLIREKPLEEIKRKIKYIN